MKGQRRNRGEGRKEEGEETYLHKLWSVGGQNSQVIACSELDLICCHRKHDLSSGSVVLRVVEQFSVLFQCCNIGVAANNH